MDAVQNRAYHEIIQIKAEEVPIMLAFHEKNAQKISSSSTGTKNLNFYIFAPVKWRCIAVKARFM